MTPPRVEFGDLRRLPGSRAHTMLCAGDDDLSQAAEAWVDHELACGSKVFYKGWFEAQRSPAWDWLRRGRRAEAHARGQLETTSFATVIRLCGGTTEGLWQLQRREVHDALRAGWPTVAMTQESTHRELADEAEIAEFGRQERGYDRLARLWPVNTLCQLSPEQERVVAVRESLALHHRDIVAGQWSTSVVAGRWRVAGELDVADCERFRAAVRGALLASTNRDVHIDLGGLVFLDSSCAEVLTEAARATVPRHRFVLHQTPILVAEMLRLLAIAPEATILRDSGR